MQIIETRAIGLQAPQDVKLRAGLTLPPSPIADIQVRSRAICVLIDEPRAD